MDIELNESELNTDNVVKKESLFNDSIEIDGELYVVGEIHTANLDEMALINKLSNIFAKSFISEGIKGTPIEVMNLIADLIDDNANEVYLRNLLLMVSREKKGFVNKKISSLSTNDLISLASSIFYKNQDVLVPKVLEAVEGRSKKIMSMIRK